MVLNTLLVSFTLSFFVYLDRIRIKTKMRMFHLRFDFVTIYKFIFIIKQSKVLEICFQITRLNKTVTENPFERNFIFFKLLTESRLWSG